MSHDLCGTYLTFTTPSLMLNLTSLGQPRSLSHPVLISIVSSIIIITSSLSFLLTRHFNLPPQLLLRIQHVHTTCIKIPVSPQNPSFGTPCALPTNYSSQILQLALQILTHRHILLLLLLLLHILLHLYPNFPQKPTPPLIYLISILTRSPSIAQRLRPSYASSLTTPTHPAQSSLCLHRNLSLNPHDYPNLG